jgi:hypothetical protein
MAAILSTFLPKRCFLCERNWIKNVLIFIGFGRIFGWRSEKSRARELENRENRRALVGEEILHFVVREKKNLNDGK